MSVPGARAATVAGVLGAWTVVLAVLCVLAPVERTVSSYSWDLVDGRTVAAAVPLAAHRPVGIRLTAGAAQTAAVPDGRAVVTTDPPTAAGPPPTGLWIGRSGDRIAVVLAGESLGSVAPGAAIEVTVDGDRATVRTGDRTIAAPAGDRRPVVVGFFSELPAGTPTEGLSASLVTDPRFATSPTALKVGLGAGAVSALGAAFAAAAGLDRRSARRLPGTRRPRGRAARIAVDGLVAATLAVWAVIGPASVDDGYTTTMVADAANTGYVGGYHHWLDSPEAPFGSFYDVFRLWSLPSTELLWLRVPSVLLGMLTWLLLRRGLLPRLVPAVRHRPGVVLLAAAAFLVAWLPFCVALRSEPWVALGSVLALCAVERGLAARRLLPIAGAVLVAALTVTVAPTGLLAVAVLVPAVPAVARWVRTRPDLPWPAVAGLLAGSAAVVLVVMFADQAPAAVQAGTRVRAAYGPNFPWFREPDRWTALLRSPDTEGSFGRRVPVLLMLIGLGLLAALGRRGRRIPGARDAVVRRLVTGTGLGLAALAIAPTKWTHHFGGFAGLGAAVVVLLGLAGGRAVLSPRHRAALVGVLALGAALSLTSAVTWWYASAQGVTWSLEPPSVGGVPLWWAALAVAAVAVAAALGAGPRRRSPPVRLVLAAVLVGALSVQTYGLVRAIVTTEGYTVGGDTLASLAGGRCGLADDVQVEPRPAAGLLTGVGGAALAGGMRAVPGGDASGSVPPRWRADTAAALVTGWYPIPAGADLVVIAAGGAGDASVVAELGVREPGGTFRPAATSAVTPGPGVTDTRLAPGGADAVRVRARVEGRAPGSWVAVAEPRVPRLVPLADLYPADAPALVDWPVAPLLPCQRTASLAGGVAEVPAFVVTAGERSAEGVRPQTGGPFAGVVELAELRPLPTYVAGATTWAVQVQAVEPRVPTRPPIARTDTVAVPGWAADLPPLTAR